MEAASALAKTVKITAQKSSLEFKRRVLDMHEGVAVGIPYLKERSCISYVMA